MADATHRIAAAPISWGVCEVPGWGYQAPASQVLDQMAQIGMAASELGPEEFVPGSAVQKREQFNAAGLRCVGAFCPVKLHDPAIDVAAIGNNLLAGFHALGATVMVLAADTGQTGYDQRDFLDETGWDTLLANMALLTSMASEQGVTACLHPHVGTMIENDAEVRRFLAESTASLCLDAGHLLVGGSDPVVLAQEVPERVAHVHLKDVDLDVLETVRSGERTYTQGVANRLYRVLGEGAIDLAAIVTSLEAAGYRGWYVPEHDRMLANPDDVETAQADAAASVAHLSDLLTSSSRL